MRVPELAWGWFLVPRGQGMAPSKRMRRSGFTILEVLISLIILAVAIAALIVSIASTHELSDVNQEYSNAYSATRAKVEELREHGFSTIYADYKAGGSVGNTWTFAGLPAIPGVPMGQVFFPEAAPVGGGTVSLRETVVDAEMGMPTGGRDLNGDEVIDENDRAADYTLLPVKLTVRWMGCHGESSLTVSTWIVEK